MTIPNDENVISKNKYTSNNRMIIKGKNGESFTANKTVLCTMDWLLDMIEYEAEHWPSDSPAHTAMLSLKNQIMSPSLVRIHALSIKLAEAMKE